MRPLRKSNLLLNTRRPLFFIAELRTLRRLRCSRAFRESTNRWGQRERPKHFAMRQTVQPLAAESDPQPLKSYPAMMRQSRTNVRLLHGGMEGRCVQAPPAGVFSVSPESQHLAFRALLRVISINSTLSICMTYGTSPALLTICTHANRCDIACLPGLENTHLDSL
jgi:hypothetical protein